MEILGTLVALGLAAVVWERWKHPYMDDLRKGDAQARHGQIDRAVASYRRALERMQGFPPRAGLVEAKAIIANFLSKSDLAKEAHELFVELLAELRELPEEAPGASFRAFCLAAEHAREIYACRWVDQLVEEGLSKELDATQKATLHLVRAEAFLSSRRVEGVREEVEHALALLKGKDEETQRLHTLARTYLVGAERLSGQEPRAKLLETALSQEKSGKSIEVLEHLTVLGELHQSLGLPQKALGYFRSAMRLLKQEILLAPFYRLRISSTMVSLGRDLEDPELLEEALEIYQKSSDELFRDNPSYLGGSRFFLALHAVLMGSWSQFETHFQAGREILVEDDSAPDFDRFVNWKLGLLAALTAGDPGLVAEILVPIRDDLEAWKDPRKGAVLAFFEAATAFLSYPLDSTGEGPIWPSHQEEIEDCLGHDSPREIELAELFGHLHLVWDRPRAALRCYQRASQLARICCLEGAYLRRRLKKEVAYLRVFLEGDRGARKLLEKLLETESAKGGLVSLELPSLQELRAAIHLRSGEFAAAERLFDLIRTDLEPAPRVFPAALTRELAWLWSKLEKGDTEELGPALKRFEKSFQKSSEPGSPLALEPLRFRSTWYRWTDWTRLTPKFLDRLDQILVQTSRWTRRERLDLELEVTWLALERGSLEEARMRLERLFERPRQNPSRTRELKQIRGYLELSSGELDASLQTFKSLEKESSALGASFYRDRLRGIFGLGWASRAQGNTELARSALEITRSRLSDELGPLHRDRLRADALEVALALDLGEDSAQADLAALFARVEAQGWTATRLGKTLERWLEKGPRPRDWV